MSGSVNKAVIIGNLTKDPEIRTMGNGKEVASFTVATSERWKDKLGERKEKSEFHKIVIFSEGLIKVASSYLKKGSKVYLEGSLQTRSWENSDGAKQYMTEIVLQGFNANLTILDSKATAEPEEAPEF